MIIKWFLLPFGGEAKWQRKMIEPVSLTTNEKILEMCCGTGGATLHISEKAGATCNITGMDLSSGQLQHAQKREYSCKTTFTEGDVTVTEFLDHSFDKVHEMPREERLKTLKEAYRVLEDNGEVIVLEFDNSPSMRLRLFVGFWFFYWLPFNLEAPTRKDMMKHGLAAEIKEARFKDVRKYSVYNGVFQTIVGTKCVD